jgi:LysM repeat protein
MRVKFRIGVFFGVLIFLAACALPPASLPTALPTLTPPATVTPSPTPDFDATPLPTREPFPVGELLAYTTQTGDTLTALAAHFNATAQEILSLNPGLSPTSTLASGQPLTIPAYWFSLGGSPYKIIPDSEFVYGPTVVDFDIDAYVAEQPGYLREMSSFVAQRHRSAAQTVLYVAQQYSVNPRLLLALMEYRTGALTRAEVPEAERNSPIGPIPRVIGLYAQLRYAAEQMSRGYYGWRTGQLTNLILRDSTTSRPDPYQTAGSVAVQFLFAQVMDLDEFSAATSPGGFGATYISLWGDPFEGPVVDVLPGNLEQPPLALPFEARQTWAFTGGPHPVWGDLLPWSALDFAPAGVTGCASTDKWVAAAAPGVVVRSGENILVLDLDGDGHEQTGWVLFHFHLRDDGLPPAGTVVQMGDPLGHPSCEGGVATGTHVHLARKYNGEWIPADGVLPGLAPFNLGGWVAQRGPEAYTGRMTRLGTWVEACTCSTARNTVYWVPE